jgi:hypothetical protein
MVLIIQIALGVVLGGVLLSALPRILAAILALPGWARRSWRGLTALGIGIAIWLIMFDNITSTRPQLGVNTALLGATVQAVVWGLIAWWGLRRLGDKRES